MSDFTDLDRKAVNAIRVLAAELPNAANSGHPGAPMGMAPMAHVLFSRHMRYDPADPFWVRAAPGPHAPIARHRVAFFFDF